VNKIQTRDPKNCDKCKEIGEEFYVIEYGDGSKELYCNNCYLREFDEIDEFDYLKKE